MRSLNKTGVIAAGASYFLLAIIIAVATGIAPEPPEAQDLEFAASEVEEDFESQGLRIPENRSNKLIVALGEQPSGGHYLDVLRAQEVGKEVHLEVEFLIPGEDVVTTDVLTYPAQRVEFDQNLDLNNYEKVVANVKEIEYENEGDKQEIGQTTLTLEIEDECEEETQCTIDLVE